MYYFLREHSWDENGVYNHIEDLKGKGLVKAMEHGAFTRVIQQDNAVQVM